MTGQRLTTSATGSGFWHLLAKPQSVFDLNHLVLLAALFLFVPSFAWADDLTVTGQQLVNRRRVSRTDVEFTFQALVTNTGSTLATNVHATLTTSSPDTLVIEGAVSFGNVPSGQTVASQDTYTIRQNRRVPFDANVLNWAIATGAPQPVTIETSPDDGEPDVALTRETVIRLSAPLAGSQVIDDSALFAVFGGQTLAGRIHLSPDRKTMTLFYNEPLPASARVRVTFNGDAVLDENGTAIDANGDGQPGGTAIFDFDTVALASVPNTVVCGRVFASQLVTGDQGMSVNVPLAGVTITVDGTDKTVQAVTDTFGNFRLEGVPVGRFFVHIDGRTVVDLDAGVRHPDLAYYPNVGKKWESVAGKEINVGQVYLPLIPADTLQEASDTEDMVLTFSQTFVDQNPQFAEFAITIPADSLFSDDGTRGGKIGIAPVPPDRLPGPLPDGLSIQDVVTIQTDGATNFDTPAPVTFPNLPDPVTGLTLVAGQKSALWSFNHDTGRFEIMGSMTVSDDGLRVVSDPGVGILAPGWHGTTPGTTGGGGEPEPEPDDEPPPCDEGCDGKNTGGPSGESCGGDGGSGTPKTDPVYMFSGEFYLYEEDLRIKGRGFDFVWGRTYRSKNGPNTAQGNGWDYTYNLFLEQSGRMIRACDGNGRRDLYRPRPDGTLGRAEFFQHIAANNDGSHSMVYYDQETWDYQPFDDTPAAGKIQRITDRNNNTLTLTYDDQGRLTKITDTLDRDIAIAYNGDGMITSVTDFSGRVVSYTYYDGVEPGGSKGDLKSVTSPAVTNTPNGNDFPDGKTRTYTYTAGFADDRLNHNLLTVTDGRRNDPNDPTFGDGPYVVNTYAATTDPDNLLFDRVVRQVWGGDVVDLAYVRQEPTATNGFAAMKTIVNDRNGNVNEYIYDIGNRPISSRVYTGRADPVQPTTETANRPGDKLRPDDPDFFETRTVWNQDSLRMRVIHPNGNTTEYTYESDLNPNASPRDRGNLRIISRTPGSHTPAGDQAVIEEFFEYDTTFSCGNCGFNYVTLHIDGRGKQTINQYDDRGNKIQIQHRIPSIVENFEYNEFGQLTAYVLPDNGSGHRRRDEFTYYDSGPQRGYRHQAIVDAGVDNFNLTTAYEYDLVGNVVRTVDPRGHDTLYVVNPLDQVVREISREVTEGSNVRYERDVFYDANNNIARRDIQNIDETGQLQTNTHFTTTYEYEILNYLVRESQEVDADHSIVTEHRYDNNRNRVLTRYGEATNGNQANNTMAMAYDERDLPFRSTRAPGDTGQSTTQLDYDANRNLVRRTEGLEDTRPRVHLAVYDSYNREVAMTDPMGNTTVYHYDPNHNRVSRLIEGQLVDIEGNDGNVRLSEATLVYDDIDRLTQTQTAFFDTKTQTALTDGLSAIVTSYSDNSQVLSVVNDNGHETLIAYDTANRRKVVTDAKGNTVTYQYDRNSNMTGQVEVEKSDLGNDDEVFTTTYAYDGLDRQTQTVDNVNNTMRQSHDSRNNRTLAIDAKQNVTRHVYDGVNRLVETIQELTDTGDGSGTLATTIRTKQAWDDTSRLVSQTDDNDHTTTYTFDALNRLTITRYADDTAHSSQYDVHDNAVGMIDANGSMMTCQYDLNNRLIDKDIAVAIGVSDETTFESYEYDGLSRLVLAEDDDSLVTRDYDSLSRITREVLNGQTTLCVYDGVGNQTQCTYPSGHVVTCTFDDLERKKTVSDQQGLIASYNYVGPSRVERRDYGNGTRCDYTYDGVTGVPNPANDFGVKQMIRSRHVRVGDGVVIDDRTYTWDRMYNKTQRKDVRTGGPQHTHDYSYDSIYRLQRTVVTDAAGLPLRDTDYGLDGVGNRITVTGNVDGGNYTLEDAEPQPADFQVNQYTNTPFDAREHDENGNLTVMDRGGTDRRDLTYNYRNMMVEFADGSNSQRHVYAYDALGRRIKKVVDADGVAEETRYFYHAFQVCEEQDNNGDVQATYVYGLYIDEVLTMGRGGVDHYYHTDQLYSVMAVTDGSGAVLQRYEYQDYGEPIALTPSGIVQTSASIDNPYQFTGRRYDPETEFFYYRSRYLQTRVGRFTTRDPLGYVDGMGLYEYTTNSPASYLDAYGSKSSKSTKRLYVSRNGKKIFGARLRPCATNCLGHATGEGGIDFANGSPMEIMNALGYQCTRGISANECKSFCECDDYVMVYINSIDPDIERAQRLKNRLKKHRPEGLLNTPYNKHPAGGTDFHGLRGKSDGAGYTWQGQSYDEGEDVPDPLHWTPTEDHPDFFDEQRIFDKMCCCKKE